MGFPDCDGNLRIFIHVPKSMDYSGSCKGWDQDYFSPPNEGKDYTWHISGIDCQLGDYILPTTLCKNQSNPLTKASHRFQR